MPWNLVVLGIGLLVPLLMDNPAWWQWLVWPVGMYLVFGGWWWVRGSKLRQFRSLKSGLGSREANEVDEVKSKGNTQGQATKLSPQEIREAKQFGVLYAELGTVMNVNRKIERLRKQRAEQGLTETENEKKFARKWSQELSRIQRQIDFLDQKVTTPDQMAPSIVSQNINPGSSAERISKLLRHEGEMEDYLAELLKKQSQAPKENTDPTSGPQDQSPNIPPESSAERISKLLSHEDRMADHLGEVLDRVEAERIQNQESKDQENSTDKKPSNRISDKRVFTSWEGRPAIFWPTGSAVAILDRGDDWTPVDASEVLKSGRVIPTEKAFRERFSTWICDVPIPTRP